MVHLLRLSKREQKTVQDLEYLTTANQANCYQKGDREKVRNCKYQARYMTQGQGQVNSKSMGL